MPSALLFGLPRRGERDAREATGRVVGTLFVTFVVMLLVGGIYYLVRRPRVTFWGRSSGGGSSWSARSFYCSAFFARLRTTWLLRS
jgi:hypothetical protein